MKRWIIGATLVMFALCQSAFAEDFTLQVTTDSPTAIYQPGQTIKFFVRLLEREEPISGIELLWSRKGDDGGTESGSFTSQKDPLVITTSMEKPGFVHLEITAVNKEGIPYKNKNGYNIAFTGGAGVGWESIRPGGIEPLDFDDFWNRQKLVLAQTPIIFTLTPFQLDNEKLDGFDVTVDCAGARPVRGYLCKPRNAAPRSLPALLSFQGYAVCSAKMPVSFASVGSGMLCLNINAHGILNGQDKEYYENLQNTELKKYGFHGNESTEGSYFLGMFLRVMRALDFIKLQPEWDGKNLVVYGGSQGGLQALAAAALDKQVSLCIASKPWLCDVAGVNIGRIRGWRPEYTDSLLYFDPANHARRISCQTILDAGLGDYVCPPSGICAVYNNLPGADRRIMLVQGADHFSYPPNSESAEKELHRILKDIKSSRIFRTPGTGEAHSE